MTLINFPHKDLNVKAQKYNTIISVNFPTEMKLFGDGTNEKNFNVLLNIEKIPVEFHKKEGSIPAMKYRTHIILL